MTLLTKVTWRNKLRNEDITDWVTISVNKSTEIKNNILSVNVKNASNKLSTDGVVIGRYVSSETKEILFNEEDELQV